jgi:hypothetical protein
MAIHRATAGQLDDFLKNYDFSKVEALSEVDVMAGVEADDVARENAEIYADDYHDILQLKLRLSEKQQEVLQLEQHLKDKLKGLEMRNAKPAIEKAA